MNDNHLSAEQEATLALAEQFILAMTSRKLDDDDRAAGHAAIAAVRELRLHRRTHAEFGDWFCERYETALKKSTIKATADFATTKEGAL